MTEENYTVTSEKPLNKKEGVGAVSEPPFKRSWTNPYPGFLSYFFKSVAPRNNAQGQLMLEWVKYADLRPYIKAITDDTGNITGHKGDVVGFRIREGFLKNYQTKREVLKQRFPSDFAHDSIKKRIF